MSRKGFTLLELLATIVLLAIIAVITIPKVMSIIDDTNQSVYIENEKVLFRAAQSYITLNSELIPTTIGQTNNIDLTTLVAAKAIEPVVDPVTKEACEGYFAVKKISETMNNYKVYIKCGTSYETDGYGEVNISVPTITIKGDNPVKHSIGTPYVDLGATAKDQFRNDITSSITVNNPVNINMVGSYNVVYTATDSQSNVKNKTRVVNVIDDVAPVITVLGSNPISIPANSVYNDAGATALDNVNGNLTTSIYKSDDLSIGIPGTYTITYTVSDSSGNFSVATRTVNVTDSIPPVITFGTNTNTTYAKTRSSVVTVTDGSAVDPSSLKYLWNTSTTTPVEGAFSLTFNNGNAVSSTAGVTGGYYLWVLAKDTSGNVAILRTGIFNLDNTIPVITRLGSSPVNVVVGAAYNDAGATASDNIDGTITSSITTNNPVNINAIATYTVTYNVTDSSGNNATQVTRTVNVVDATPPTVTFGTTGNLVYAKNRSSVVTVTDGSGVDAASLKYLWSTSATDPLEGAFSLAFTNGGTVTSTAGLTGSYYLWILAKDTSGNRTIIKSSIFNLDNTAPVITRLGSNPINIAVGTAYNDAGATASDNIDGTITSSITTNNPVNINSFGTYTVTYNVSDSSGNAATQITRTVNMTDVTAPSVAFGTNTNTTYAKTRSSTVTVTDTQSGVSAASLKYLWSTSVTEPLEGAFSLSFTNGGTVTSTAGLTGSYYLWILAKDASGNTAIIKSGIFNLDNTPPVITMNGSTPINHPIGTAYTDAQATATDNVDGSLTTSISVTSNFAFNILGSYTISYNVSDSSGNAATQVSRTVNVVDITAPSVAFGTAGNMTYAKTRSTTVTVTDAHSGVSAASLKYLWSTSATDPLEGAFSLTFTNGGTVTSTAGLTGSYYLWILAKDVSGNMTITKSAIFNLDNTAPVITMTGSSPITHDLGAAYNDAGATATDNIDGTITGSISTNNGVNINAVGSYSVTYNVSDSSGNAATQVTRTVNVADATIFNFAYTGAQQTFNCNTTGTYSIQVWGASGGSSTVSGSIGGVGAYAYGEINLTLGNTLYVYAGGMGAQAGTTTTAGGFNGGGSVEGHATAARKAGSGGGASDVRLGGTALTNRIIIAGGGGGSGSRYSNYFGGYGGGGNNHVGLGAGTSSAGGSVGGALGTGGNGAATSRGGGGGGYYGGGSGGTDYYGGGGGSSYLGTMANATSAAGGTSIPAPGGGTETGHTGDGYVRITFLHP